MSTQRDRGIRMRRAFGVSLVELMIAMTLGLVTVGAIGYIYLGTGRAYRTQDALARLQEGARYAFEVISNDLRMAGAAACSHATHANVVPDLTGANWHANLFDLPVQSVEKSGATGTQTEFSDALRVVRADISREHIVQGHVATTQTFTLNPFTTISNGDVLLATDCSHAAVFRATSVSTPVVKHEAGLNSTGDLGATGSITYLANKTRIYPLSAATYYVANNPAGVPSLYRWRPAGAEELIEGVEDLQVTFGVDVNDDGSADVNPLSAANPYRTAAQVTDWSRVVSVRISLLMRTVENNVVPEKQAYTYDGVTVAAASVPDRRLRKVFTHVINMRNQ